MVAVKDRDELPFGIFQRIIDVAGLGVFVAGAGDIVHPNIFGKLAKRFPSAVVEDPDVQLVLRPVDTLRGVNGVFHHVEIFVIGGDEDVHSWPQIHVLRQRHRLAIQRPDHLEVAQHQHHPGVGLCEQQNDPAHQTYRVVPVQRRGIAPPDIAARHRQRQHDQHQRRETARDASHQQRHAPQQHQEDKLRQRVKGLRNTHQRQHQRAEGHPPKDRPAQFRIEVRQLFLFIQMAGAGVHLLRQFFQPLRIATVHPFQRRQRTPVDLFLRLRHARRQ